MNGRLFQISNLQKKHYICIMHQESPRRSTNRAARSHGGKVMRMFNQKKVCIMDKYNFFKTNGLCPDSQQLLQTTLFYLKSTTIIRRFDDWKDIDKFYFIPLYMRMTYSCSGWVAEIAEDPIWLGSYIQTIITNPGLFLFDCPTCGNDIKPYRYLGSPLSGRVDLEGMCSCGWKGYKTVNGWKIRAIALRNQINKDRLRYYMFRILHPNTLNTITELLSFIKK